MTILDIATVASVRDATDAPAARSAEPIERWSASSEASRTTGTWKLTTPASSTKNP